MKFTDPLPIIPRIKPPVNSWWATPRAQESRDGFVSLHAVNVNRIVGNERFGGAKRTHNKSEKSR